MENKKHISTVIKSLDKNYREAKINGVLNNNDVYYIDILEKLLNQCNVDISSSDYNKLLLEYTKIVNTSNYICKSDFINQIQYNKIPKFTQAENSDCDNKPITKIDGIYYWQENNIVISSNEILDLITIPYFKSKNYDTYLNFRNGKTIDYSNVSRIVFVDSNSSTILYKISDILGNDITSYFTITNIPSLNCTAIISRNIYAYGEVFIKITKLGLTQNIN